MEDNRDSIQSLKSIKIAALGLAERLISDDPTEVQAAMQEYSALVDRFYRANEHLMPSSQYEAAKRDFEYFMVLLDLAIQYEATSEKKIEESEI